MVICPGFNLCLHTPHSCQPPRALITSKNMLASSWDRYCGFRRKSKGVCPGPAARTGVAWSLSPWSQDPHKPPSWIPLLRHPHAPQPAVPRQRYLYPCSLYLGSGPSPQPREVNPYSWHHFQALCGLQWCVTKFVPFLSISDPCSAPTGVLRQPRRARSVSESWACRRPGWVWDRTRLAPLFTSWLWGLTLQDLDEILEAGGGHRVPAMERVQGLAECSPSITAVQRVGQLPGGRMAVLSALSVAPALGLLKTWVSRDSRPLGRADMLAGREGNGTVVHFLGRARNNQGGTFDPGPRSVCVSLNLSLLLSRLPVSHPPLPPACLPAAVPRGEHHEAGRHPGKCYQLRRLVSALRPPGGSLVPVPLPQALPAAKISQPGMPLWSPNLPGTPQPSLPASQGDDGHAKGQVRCPGVVAEAVAEASGGGGWGFCCRAGFPVSEPGICYLICGHEIAKTV